jgi:polar amino acid transport system substrate-binding protein
MKKFLVILPILLTIILCNIGFAQEQPARDLVASLAQLSGQADSPDKGTLVDLVKAIDDVYPGRIKIEVYPFPRSIDNVIKGNADFQIPNLRNPNISMTNIPYQFVSEKIGSPSSVIYSNSDKIITRKMLDEAVAKGGKFPYLIEGVSGMESFYSFPYVVSTIDLTAMLQKVQNKKIDAFLWIQDEADLTLRQLKFNSIHRELYGVFDEMITIPKGPKGDELNAILSDCLRKLKTSGRLQELYSKKEHQPYTNWQPNQMGW